MRTADEVSPQKLRGGFYSPPGLVRLCLDRVARLTTGRHDLVLLEPSAGDGAFVRGLADHPLRRRVARTVAVEPDPVEAGRCRTALHLAALPGRVVTASALSDTWHEPGGVDVVVGNPPYVRYQFVADAERDLATAVARRCGVEVRGVSNLWIPVTLAALDAVRDAGAFAMIVPLECLTGVSAAAVRTWLVRHTAVLRLDLVPPGSFPGVVQDVVVLSGRVRRTPRHPGGTLRVDLVEHLTDRTRAWHHRVRPTHATWTRLLLAPAQAEVVDAADTLPGTMPLGDVVTVRVSTVTGANDYFCLDDETRAAYGLAPWTRPLLARLRHAPGLVHTPEDRHDPAGSTLKRWMLHLGPGPLAPGPQAYVARGAAEGLAARYKCRIREPWYAVPPMPVGHVLLSKRTHRHPRLVLNQAGAVTTDTIYQGVLRPGHEGSGPALVAGFHNSLTLLTAELEGRSFGGGVLELVPSEAARLRVPLVPALADALPALDALARTHGTATDALLDATDALLGDHAPGIGPDVLGAAHEAWHALSSRRLARSAGVAPR